MESVGHYIAGTRRRGAGDRTSPIYNPATGEQTGQTILATVGEVDAAVSSAVDGFSIWGQMPAKERVEVLFNYRDLLKKNIGEIAGLITQEHGKTIDDAKGGIGRGIEVVEYACGIAQMLKGEHSNEVGRGIDSWSVRAPLGVCVGITPFNFPAMVPMWMFPISIACGNSFILKPSERDPSGPIALAALLSEAGAPPGVLNVI
ncbi:MAG: aldehyde dehydrogenase family protein, partial [Litorimonas sp.]